MSGWLDAHHLVSNNNNIGMIQVKQHWSKQCCQDSSVQSPFVNPTKAFASPSHSRFSNPKKAEPGCSADFISWCKFFHNILQSFAGEFLWKIIGRLYDPKDLDPKAPSINHLDFRPEDCCRDHKQASWHDLGSCQNDWQVFSSTLYGSQHWQSQGGCLNTFFILAGSVPRQAKVEGSDTSSKEWWALRLLIVKLTSLVLQGSGSSSSQEPLSSSSSSSFHSLFLSLPRARTKMNSLKELCHWMQFIPRISEELDSVGSYLQLDDARAGWDLTISSWSSS